MPDASIDPQRMTVEDIAQIVEAIEHFVIGPEEEDPELRAVWQPYIDKLNMLRDLLAAPAAPGWQELEELLRRIVTGDGSQLENLSISDDEWPAVIEDVFGDGNECEIAVKREDWIALIQHVREREKQLPAPPEATSQEPEMRTLFEIIEAAKVGEPTTHDECLYALLAYAGLSYFDSSALRKLAFEPSKFRTPEREAEESHRRWKMALDKSPKDWLGPNNDPANPACQRRVKLARKLFDKVAGAASQE